MPIKLEDLNVPPVWEGIVTKTLQTSGFLSASTWVDVGVNGTVVVGVDSALPVQVAEGEKKPLQDYQFENITLKAVKYAKRFQFTEEANWENRLFGTIENDAPNTFAAAYDSDVSGTRTNKHPDIFDDFTYLTDSLAVSDYKSLAVALGTTDVTDIVMTKGMANHIKSLTDGTGRPLFSYEDLSSGNLSLLGHPIHIVHDKASAGQSWAIAGDFKGSSRASLIKGGWGTDQTGSNEFIRTNPFAQEAWENNLIEGLIEARAVFKLIDKDKFVKLTPGA